MKNTIYILIFHFLLIPFLLSGQIAGDVSNHILTLHRALVSRDTGTLHHLLDDQLTYGHSNGWIESKEELIANNAMQKMIYQSIAEDSISVQINGSTAIARFNATIKGLVAERNFHLKLHVCQTWILVQNSWKLWARQAVKLETLD